MDGPVCKPKQGGDGNLSTKLKGTSSRDENKWLELGLDESNIVLEDDEQPFLQDEHRNEEHQQGNAKEYDISTQTKQAIELDEEENKDESIPTPQRTRSLLRRFGGGEATRKRAEKDSPRTEENELAKEFTSKMYCEAKETCRKGKLRNAQRRPMYLGRFGIFEGTMEYTRMEKTYNSVLQRMVFRCPGCQFLLEDHIPSFGSRALVIHGQDDGDDRWDHFIMRHCLSWDGEQSAKRVIQALHADLHLSYCAMIPDLVCILLLWLKEAEVFEIVRRMVRESKTTRRWSSYTLNGKDASCKFHFFPPDVKDHYLMVRCFSNFAASRKLQIGFDQASSCLSQLFLNVLPLRSVIRVVDCFLVEGIKALFRIGLSLLKLGLIPSSSPDRITGGVTPSSMGNPNKRNNWLPQKSLSARLGMSQHKNLSTQPSRGISQNKSSGLDSRTRQRRLNRSRTSSDQLGEDNCSTNSRDTIQIQRGRASFLWSSSKLFDSSTALSMERTELHAQQDKTLVKVLRTAFTGFRKLTSNALSKCEEVVAQQMLQAFTMEYQSLLLEAPLMLPHFPKHVVEESKILLTVEHFNQLVKWLPKDVRCSAQTMRLQYSPERDGLGLAQLYARCSDSGIAACIVVIRPLDGPRVFFGAYYPSRICESQEQHEDKSFLFQMPASMNDLDECKIWRRVHSNSSKNTFVKTAAFERESIRFGAVVERDRDTSDFAQDPNTSRDTIVGPGLWLNEDLTRGHTGYTVTYENEPLCLLGNCTYRDEHHRYFGIHTVEVFAFPR